MSGTKLGGKRAYKTNTDRYGKDYYVRIGAKGGQVTGVGKGFGLKKYCDKPCLLTDELGKHYVAQCAGTKGGTKSRR